MNAERFVAAYIACALWSSNDPDSGDPLDRNMDASDLAPPTRARMEADCKDFLQLAAEPLERSGLSSDRAGHDFWLTRNGHGAGFWDRGLGAVGDELTALSKPYGGCSLFVGDDGLVHLVDE